MCNMQQVKWESILTLAPYTQWSVIIGCKEKVLMMFSQHSIVVIRTKNRRNKIVKILSGPINDQEFFKVPSLTAMIKTFRTGLPILLIYLRMNACRIYRMDAWKLKTFQFCLCFPTFTHWLSIFVVLTLQGGWISWKPISVLGLTFP